MTKKANVCELSLIAVKLVNDSINQINSFDLQSNNHNSNDSNNNANEQSVCRRTDRFGDVLGFVTLNSLSVKLSEFRNLMSTQINCLPQKFMFLSKDGWPVSDSQELDLNLYYVISDSFVVLIRRIFEKQRFGVHMLRNSTQSVPFGFIFADFENTGNEIRQIINQELFISHNEENSYQLIDRNGWPVTQRQESMIKVWDLMNNGIFRIFAIKRDLDNDVPDYNFELLEETNSPTRKKKRPSEASTVIIDRLLSSENNTSVVAFNSVVEQHSNHSTPNISSATIYHPIATENKPILISYVRAEAEQHARQLKSELNDLGCHVFLDVDEIEGGHDWADALNNAVLKCDLFVPLITPQYGYTQWTNREIKLADVKKKQIIPISFLEFWPPDCLAIQFASTQFIPWKTVSDIQKSTENGEGERARDIRFWDQPYVRSTATRISDHYKNIDKEIPESDSAPTFAVPQMGEEVIQKPNIPSKPGFTTKTSRPTTLMPPALNSLSSIKKKRKQIVISAHPKQKEFVALLREELNKFGFDVWCSTDWAIGTTPSDDYMTTPASDYFRNDFNSPMTPSIQTTGMECSGSDNTSDQTLYIGSQSHSESSQDSQALTPIDHIMARTFQTRHRLNFSLSMSDPMNYPNCSQNTEFGSQASNFSPEDFNKAKNFRHRADAACIVIMVLSKSYCNSRTCKQQAFYCDFRKRVIPIIFDDFFCPHWLSKMYDDEDLIENNSDVQSVLKKLNDKISKIINSSKVQFKCAMSEARIDSLASFISKQLPVIEKKKVMVYVAGSTKFFSPISESICRAIGQSLASIPFLVLVTGGCYGVAETTGRSFCEERELLLKEKPANLYHILPRYASQDLSLKARQNPDGTFQTIPFGHTLFIGDSFKERDSVVARLFNYCILIEGGPRSARIAEEFMWNDNNVIPIICTGGAAAGDYDLPAKIHDIPLGVHKDDWSTLVRRDVTAENIAESVKNIICSLVKCRSRKKGHNKHNTGLKSNKSRSNKLRTKS